MGSPGSAGWGLAALAGFLTDLGLANTPDGSGEMLEVAFAGDSPTGPRAGTVRLASSAASVERMLLVDVTYPFTAAHPDDARLAGALLAPWFLLGHTEVDDDASVHHRYACVVSPDGALPAGTLAQVFSVLTYEQLHFGDYLEGVCVRGVAPALLPEIVARAESEPTD